MDSGVILRILLLFGVAILLFVPTVWAIRDVAYRSFPSLKTKVLWFVLVTLLPPFGGLIYFVAGRPRVQRQMEESEYQGETSERRSEEPLD
jgi:beta-lactamase regulating signal transducer with metallopeptidase domain